MLIYRSPTRLIGTKSALSRVLDAAKRTRSLGRSSRESAREALIDLGEIESAVADVLCPEFDETHSILGAFRHAGRLAGRIFSLVCRKDIENSRNFLPEFEESLQKLLCRALPEKILVSVPEGYAYYALYPEMYLLAAGRFFREHRPGEAVCIGIRSIGASLCSAVCGELENLGCTTHSLSIRPHGHPFERRVDFGPELQKFIAGRRELPFLIIDEGPGMSGSSFCSTAEKIGSMGIPDNGVFLFPSWQPDGTGFISEKARRTWPRWKKYSASFEEMQEKMNFFEGLNPGGRIFDFSAGKWRSHLFVLEERFPAVQHQHERRKFVSVPALDSPGSPVLLKFCGLGNYGKRVYERSCLLAEAGYLPPVHGLADGFVRMDFLPGVPLGATEPKREFLDTAAGYFAFIAEKFPSDERIDPGELVEMVRVNISEGLGVEWESKIGKISALADGLRSLPAVYLDNRVAPHEWIRMGKRIYKMDAAEHFDDHFFPGPQGIAWDLAAFCIEFGLDSGAKEYLVGKSSRLNFREEVLDFYTIAYLAFRLGYCSVASSIMGNSPDGRRFIAKTRTTAALLQAELARIA